MWQCPKCKRSFRNTNQQHSCNLVSKEDIIKKRSPELQSLYKKISIIVKVFGPYREEAIAPDVIFFKTKSSFMAVKMKKDHVDVEFFLDHRIDDPSISKSLQVSAKRIAYIVPIDCEEDITKQLVSWMRYSYELITN